MVRVRRLAFVPRLGDDESFVSFIDRTALALEVSRPAVLRSLGLITSHQDRAAGLGVDLTDAGFLKVSAATGLPRERIEQSLVRRFGSTGVDLAGLDVGSPDSVRAWARWSWAYVNRSNCCPRCVAETGAWKVQWRTVWQCLCPQHERYLISVCPQCGKPLYSHQTLAAQVTVCCGPAESFAALRADGRPRVRRSGKDLCRQPIQEFPTTVVADSTMVATQRRLLALLDAPSSESDAARSAFMELQSCMVLAWNLGTPDMLDGADPVLLERFERHCRERDDLAPRKGVDGPKYRSYSLTPTDPLLVAAGVRISEALVFGDASEEAAERFVSATYSHPELRKRWIQLPKFWTPPDRLVAMFDRARAKQGFAVAANLDGRSRARAQVSHPRLSWRNVPQLLWQRRADEIAPGLFSRGWREHQRRFLSIALARYLSPELSTWSTAAVALGLPGEVAANCNRASSHLRQTGKGAELERFLCEMTEALDGLSGPIDYDARRQGLADLVDLDPSDWEAVVLGTGRKRVNRHWADRRRSAAAWVWVTATGGDFHLAPSLMTYELPVAERGVADNRYRQYFVGRALPEIEADLARLAETILFQRGLRGPLVQDP